MRWLALLVASLMGWRGRSAATPMPMAINKEDLLQMTADQYLNSHDFNGLPVSRVGISIDECRLLVRPLVENGSISVNFGDRHCNPHIIAFEPEPATEQLAKLDGEAFEHACLYPTRSHLETVVPANLYADRPFSRMLALGEPQLGYRSFDLSVLEDYRNDPRFLFEADISGSLSIKDSGEVREADQVFIQTFGFSYNENLDRAVAVFLRYLTRLSPEHQRIWQARMLEGEYWLHPDYLRRSMGEWGTGVSMFSAFLHEMKHVNAICRVIGRPALFRQNFTGEQKPRSFGFLLRPTLREFNEFVHELDKMISDNIDNAFFRNEVSADLEVRRPDGSVVVERKGTLRMLGEWLDKQQHELTLEQKECVLQVFRKIRQLRQKPAHALQEDAFDKRYIHEQRELMEEACNAMRSLRKILQSHQAAGNYEVEGWLENGRIWTY